MKNKGSGTAGSISQELRGSNGRKKTSLELLLNYSGYWVDFDKIYGLFSKKATG